MARHTYEDAESVPFGRERIRVRRCTRCGCTPQMALAKDPCPVKFSSTTPEGNRRAKANFIAKYGRRAWYERHYATRREYRQRQAEAAE